MKKQLTLAVLALLSCTVNSADIMEFNQADDFAVSPKVVFDNNIFRISGAGRFMNKNAFPVDGKKTCTLSMKIRLAPDSAGVFAHVGFQQFDGQGKFLLPEYYRMEKKTRTTLLEQAPAGSNQIRIKAPEYWRRDALRLGWYVAFDTTGEPDDVPNMNLNKIQQIEEIPGGLLVSMQDPLKEPCRKDSVVCFHSAGPGMYTLLPGKKLSPEWTELTGKVHGVSAMAETNQWWRDAVTAKILFVLSPDSENKNIAVEFKDVKLIVGE